MIHSRILLGITAFVSLLFGFPMWSSANVYNYYPKNTLTLGSSFDPLYPDRAFPSCLSFQSVDHPVDHGAPKTDFTTSEIHSRQELYHQLNVDVNLSASGAFASGSASFKLDEKYHFEADDAYYMLKASSDYGRFTILNPLLTEEAGQLKKNPTAFRQRCGSEFVYQERRMAQVVAIYSFQHMTESQQKQVKASFSASGFGVSFGADYAESGSSDKDKMQVTVDIYAIGGGGIKVLAEISTAPGLDKVKEILEDYISQAGPDQAAPIEFVTGGWESFGVPIPIERMELRNAVLPELYFSFRENESNFHRLGALIRSATLPRSKIKPADLTAFQKQYQDLGEIMIRLLNEGRACLQDETNCLPVPLPTVYKVDWPQAVFETQWLPTDEDGNPYTMEFTVRAYNLGKATTHGSFDVPMKNARLASADYVCTDPRCGYSYNRSDAKGYEKDVEIAADQKSFTWYRRWGGDEHDEKYVVHYEVLRTVCVDNCNYLMTVKATGGATSQATPAWDFSSTQRRALIRPKKPSVKPAPESVVKP